LKFFKKKEKSRKQEVFIKNLKSRKEEPRTQKVRLKFFKKKQEPRMRKISANPAEISCRICRDCPQETQLPKLSTYKKLGNLRRDAGSPAGEYVYKT